MVGAREFLIAWNIDLATADVATAQAIARKVRESSGGFPFVKAMGVYLEARQCAQVSMNLTNYREIPLEHLYETIASEARQLNTGIAASELIGFIPRHAFQMAPDFFRRAVNFSESRILENRIEEIRRSRPFE
jgi:glutamate formiminotransferase